MHACQLRKGQILKYLDPLVTSNRHPYNLVPVASGAGLLQNAWVVFRVKIVLAGFGWSCSAFTATHRCVHALSGALTCCGGICTQHVRSFHDCFDLPPASHHKSLHLSTRGPFLASAPQPVNPYLDEPLSGSDQYCIGALSNCVAHPLVHCFAYT